jgi:O-antigen/teichoic acid export membrane protein
MINNKDQIAEKYFAAYSEDKNFKKTVIRSGGIAVFTRMTSQIIQTISIFILARMITPKDFGLVAIASSITGFLIFLNDLGLSDAIVQEKEVNHKQVSTLFWINLSFSASITLILIALSPFISWVFKEDQLNAVFIISSFIFFISGASSLHRTLLKRSMSFKHLAIIEISTMIASSLVAILLAFFGFSYWALTLRPIINYLLMFVLSWIFCQWRPGLPSRNSNVMHLLKFGANQLGTLFLNNISKNLDKTLIGWKFGKESLGYYSRAYSLADIPTNQLASSLYVVSISTLSKLRDDPVEFRRYYLKAIATTSFIGMPISALLVTMSKDLIYVLLGPQWGMAATIFSILGLSTGIQIIYATNSWLHVSLGRADRWFRWNIVSSIIFIISFIIGLFFSVTGVAVCYIVAVSLLTFPALLYAGKPIKLKITEILNSIWRNFISALTAGVLNWFIFNKLILFSNQIIRLVLSLFIFSFLYLSLISLFYLSFKPIIDFLSILKHFLPKKVIKGDKKQL